MSDPAPRKPMLFSPPLPPLSLDARPMVVIGRSRDCDLVLPTPDASLQHCKVSAQDERFSVRDLESRNGTFVNGERIRIERVLSPGDQIEVGSATITFCEVASGLHRVASSDAETQFFSKPTPAEALQGDLAEIPPFAVLQILEMGEKTGMLELSGDDGIGRLWFTAGRPTHAQVGKRVGFDAAVELTNTARGRFSFEPQIDAPHATIDASITELLLEAARQLDEAREGEAGGS